MAVAGERPLRADAERNRRLVLEAAAQAFAEKGLDVGVAEIARRAGVGNATVFRHFPTKDALIEAIIEDRVAEVVAVAGRASAHEDPWEALVGFLEATAALQRRDRGFFQASEQYLHKRPAMLACHRPILDAVDPLVRRAQAAGVLRDDITAVDVMAVMKGAVAGRPPVPGVPADQWRRILSLVLDGLRPAAATPAPLPPVSYEDVETAIAQAGRGPGRPSG
jgi:AcrR family transcriptional regulator